MKNLNNSTLTFVFSEKNLPKSVIGRLFSLIDVSWVTPEVIETAFLKPNVEIIDVNGEPSDICCLPNGLVILAEFKNNVCTIYDQDFNFIKEINKIDNMDFKPYRLATNDVDCIYITDSVSHSVIMTDFNLKKINSFKELPQSEFRERRKNILPTGICFDTDYVYVCNDTNHSLIKLTSKLEFVELIKLGYNPWQVKTNKEILCIKSTSINEIYFYDKKTFELIQKYSHGYGRVSEINSYFYDMIKLGDELKIFDSNGLLIKSIDLSNCINFNIGSRDWYITFLNSRILISSYFSTQIACLKIKNN